MSRNVTDKYREPFLVNNTNFIYKTNFEGNPAKDPKFHSTKRQCCIIIPTQEQKEELEAEGIRIFETHPREGEEEGFVPTYYVRAKLGYNHPSRKPKVNLVTNGVAQPLSEENVALLDDCYVQNVKAKLTPAWDEENNKYFTELWIDVLYVEQDIEEDPYAAEYEWKTN